MLIAFLIIFTITIVTVFSPSKNFSENQYNNIVNNVFPTESIIFSSKALEDIAIGKNIVKQEEQARGMMIFQNSIVIV